ncbi:MAG: copper amine oxidase N-terminal domain-containing protein [Clostridiales bacterium]|nr:copper amine oxidase N-terminal domain-containing protein [Clostridiales bacterium]
MKKKIALTMAISALAVSSLALNVSADEYTEVSLYIAGQEVVTDQPAVIVDNRTMVPVRVIAESIGCLVDWDETTKTVTFTQNGVVASMVIGETSASIAEGDVVSEVEIDSPAVIINSRTMVPVRFISELFGCEVDWNAATKTVSISVADYVESDADAFVEETTEDNIAEDKIEADNDTDNASGETSYSSGTYYIGAENNTEHIYEDMIFIDGVLIYEDFSNDADGKGSYGIYPGETEPYDSPIEQSPYYGMTVEEVIAALEANGCEVTFKDSFFG